MLWTGNTFLLQQGRKRIGEHRFGFRLRKHCTTACDVTELELLECAVDSIHIPLSTRMPHQTRYLAHRFFLCQLRSLAGKRDSALESALAKVWLILAATLLDGSFSAEIDRDFAVARVTPLTRPW